MKAADFEYVRAGSIAEACRLLSESAGDGKIIAGGQTLVPMMAMRLAKPAMLIDINGVAELEGIESHTYAVVIRAGTRQADALSHDIVKTRLPLLAKAIGMVGHSQTRNRGTVGGSLANADPSAEICLVARTLDATLTAQSVSGARDIAAAEFFESAMTTALTPEECLTRVTFPVWRDERVGTGFQEVSARKSDFALASAAVQISLDAKGACQKIAIGIGGVEAAPVRAGAVEVKLTGTALGENDVAAVLPLLDDILFPRDDLYASAAYRLRVARALMQRAIAEAKSEALAGAHLMSLHRIRLTVNGEIHEAEISARVTLVDFLRETLRLTGTHTGCEHGVCGACSVSFNGRPIRSCLMFAVQADGANIITVEGLAPADESLSVLQDSFWEKHALQCGFCTPGMLIASQSLLNENKAPTEEEVREAISGNLCRCTGYKQIVEAVMLAAQRLQGKNTPETDGTDTVKEGAS